MPLILLPWGIFLVISFIRAWLWMPLELTHLVVAIEMAPVIIITLLFAFFPRIAFVIAVFFVHSKLIELFYSLFM